MNNFITIKQKLEQFIKRYYINELLKGVILFFATGFLYLIFTLFVEYVLWLNPMARTILFWVFIVVEVTLFIKFIAIPLLHLFKLRQGINYETASQLIGNHFPEVSDKLLNVLQLNQSANSSDLLVASIAQKSKELQPIPFKSAINFASNTKYIKYAALPIAIVLVSFLTGKINWFSDSYERVVNYQTAYLPPAPFQFFVLNDKLQAIENKDFTLKISTVGAIVPQNAKIQYNGQSYFLEQLAPGEFQHLFPLPKQAIEFTLSANGVVSKQYTLQVVNTPNLVNFELHLAYPLHTKKPSEVLKSTGTTTIPEGTKTTWVVNTKSTTDVAIYANDTLKFTSNEVGVFKASKRLFNDYNYSITTSNESLKDYENLAFNIKVVKDTYPELNIKIKKDSLDQQSLYIFGQATDDYGLSQLNLVYYPENEVTKKVKVPIKIASSNFTEFISAFPNQLNIKDGISYQLYFEVFDNDVIHKYKRTKSSVFSYRKRTKQEEEQKQLNAQSETIKDISKTFNKLKAQDKKLSEFSKLQKEKKALNFNDKKKFEDFLKRQKNQEQLMKNFNKKLQKNLDEFQTEKKEKDVFKDDLKKRLKENEMQLQKDEKLLKELEQLKDKINKEEFSQKLEELAKQNKAKKRNMKQLLELTKRFYVMKKAEKIANKINALSKKQEQLAENDKENTKEAQDTLNADFERLQKELDALKAEDKLLHKPLKFERDRFLEDDIKFDQKAAKDALKQQEKSAAQQKPQVAKQQQQKAKQSQKKASKKMKQMSALMKKKAGGGGGGGNQTPEDIDTLRQILENLLSYSFDQEELMNTFNAINVNNNKYGTYIRAQNNLRAHFEHIDDSLFSLALRQPKISQHVNTQITEVYFNIDKALSQLTENNIYKGVAAQQYTITASNELASFLNDILDTMEMSMNPSPGSGGGGDEQLPDIIMSQEALNKKMEDGVKKSEEGKPNKEGDTGKKGKGDKPGEDGKSGEDAEGENPGDKGKQGKDGESGESGANGKSGTQPSKGGKGGKSGENGSDKGEGNPNRNNGKHGKNVLDGKGENNEGYGEGGREEQNGELFKIYQQQQQLRQALEDRLSDDGTLQSAGELIKQMEAIELDLLNTGFTRQTLQKMMDVQHQLLKLKHATFMQGEDTNRTSDTNTKRFNSTNENQILNAKQYFNTTEILNRQALPLQNHFKKKIKDYFSTAND
ncbi:MAG: hypothetical protein ACPGUH_05895 [Winogradskyella sp.]